ncbi:PEP-CTERM sorting domain-containing protein [Lacipirellula parvula]|uniref:Ice-binding protein C-terminal domain-containing protein n=1 Tax=Lacipirellula parvula TaxID=2650471 RepID=A0A5K7X3Q4_9BACT|nr:PEP-CTERM sorting domain-containing protein [Lacipirellula parvula]BBO30452.1 hypothetical protein PLANPX_0064 [Lacipirellula parvula]
MKTLSSILSLSIVLACVGWCPQTSAEVIGADDFSESNGTAVNGKPADVGGAWSAPGAQTIVGGVLDTDQVGQHQGSFLDFTRALGAGEVLTLTFRSAESAGTMFDINGYAGMSLYVGGSEKLFIGDPGGGQPVNGWALDGFAGGGPSTYTGVGNEAVTGTFTYNFDTGFGRLAVSDGVNSASTTHNYDPGLALNRFRIQSGSSDAASISIDSFSVSAAQVPEPASIGLLAAGLLGGLACSRRR